MKRRCVSLLSLVIVVLFLSQFAFADTEVGGLITEDTTWTLADSPYIATGNVLVSEGVTLTVEPSVEVKFESGKVLQVEGALIAKGASDNLITFTSNQPSPAPGDWGYIYFTDTSTDATFDENGNYTGGSILEHSVVEYAGGLSVDDNGSVRMNDAHPFINYCTIQNNSASGINAWNLSGTFKLTNSTISNNTTYSRGGGIYTDSGTVIISNNTISNNTACSSGGPPYRDGGGIYAYGGTVTISNNNIIVNNGTNVIEARDGDAVTISGNTISDSSGTGIYAVGGTTMTISNNSITDNTGWGIQHYGGTVETISNNSICNNTAGGIWSGYSTLTISNNIICNNGGPSSNGGGIYLPPATVTISNNIISDNVFGGNYQYGGGIYTSGGPYGGHTGTIIHNNSIIRNSAYKASAVHYSGGDDQNFNYNTITGNVSTGNDSTYTVYVSSFPLFNYNNLYNNTGATYELFNANSDGSEDVNAGNNWWGTEEESEIQAKIYDWYDDGTKGFVDYAPFLTSIDSIAPISPSLGLTVIGMTAESISIQWDASTETDTAGYLVYWDTDGELPYGNVVDVGNVTSYTITELTPGTYYVTVTAYDIDYDATNDNPDTIVNENQTNGNESWYATVKDVALSPDISVFPISHDFGSVNVGDTSTSQTFTISNDGVTDLEIDTLSIIGTDASEFEIQNDNCLEQTVSPSATCMVDVVFSPTEPGTKTANLSIPSNDPDEPTLNVALEGDGNQRPEASFTADPTSGVAN